MSTSRYQISKSRREVKRLEGLLAEAEAKQASFLAKGARISAEEIGWRIADLKDTIAGMNEWQRQASVSKFNGWSPARLQRHHQRHGS